MRTRSANDTLRVWVSERGLDSDGLLDMLQLLTDCVSGRSSTWRNQLIVETCVVEETRSADARRDCQRVPAAEVGDGDVLDIETLQHPSGGDDRIVSARVRCQAGMERSWNRKGALPIVGRQTDIARRQGKAIGIADRPHDPDLQREVQIANELFDHRDLLGVL